MDAVQILIADDHDLIRRGLMALLESHPGWKVCAEARTGAEAISKAEKLKPHVAILDITMPELNGLDATRKIREVCPKIEVLALSVHYSDQLIRDMVEAGARGYIVKSDSDRDLVVAVEALSHHKPFFTSRASEVMSSPVNATGDIKLGVGPEQVNASEHVPIPPMCLLLHQNGTQGTDVLM